MYMTNLIEEEIVPEVSNLAWSADRAAVGDQVELTADVSGDAEGLVFRVTNSRGQAIATLPPLLAAGKARASWRVPPFGDRGEQYDFAAWRGDQRLGASDRLFVGAPGACELARPALKVLEGGKARRHVHLGRVRAVPARALEGDTVELRAFVLCADDGETVTFRVFRFDAEVPCAVVEGKVRGQFAVAPWTVSCVEDGRAENGMKFVDFDLEAECGGAGERSHCIGELRGYAAGACAAK